MKKVLAALMIFAAAASAQANTDGYVMLSVFYPGQIPIATTSLDGMRMNIIYGECQNINGFDIGISGRVRERMNGLQIAGANLIGTDANGAQLALVNYIESDFAGCQVGVWNCIGGEGKGFQLGVYNDVAKFSGFQMGIVNWAHAFNGFQLGLVNYASKLKDEMRGNFVQVGLVNINGTAVNAENGEREAKYVLPFVNWNW